MLARLDSESLSAQGSYACDPSVRGHGSRLALERLVECRIEVVREDEHPIVRLAGRLAAAQAGAFLEACAAAGTAPVLDLTDLVSADAVGLDALLRMQAQGARLVGLPEYMRLKLELLVREGSPPNRK